MKIFKLNKNILILEAYQTAKFLKNQVINESEIFHKVKIFNSFFLIRIYFSHYFILKKKFNYCDYIAGPLHINNNHLTLFFVSIVSKKIFYIDPSGSSQDKLDNKSKYFITFNQTTRYFNNIDFSNILIDHQFQNDTYNCCVFVCYFYELFLNFDLTLFSNDIDIDQYRNYIISKYLQYNKMTSCLAFKIEKIKSFMKVFPSNLNVLDCGHAFHNSCLKNKSCVICIELNSLFHLEINIV